MASNEAPTGRRVRVDRFGLGPVPDLEGGASGRVVVVVIVLGVLLLWGGLYLGFRHWRAGYRARAAFGLERVVKAVGPLATLELPPDVDAEAWRAAVSETRAMLVTLTTANVLDRAGMEALGVEIDARAARARARPATALAELAGLWDDVEARAGPVVVRRHPRPTVLASKTSANQK